MTGRPALRAALPALLLGLAGSRVAPAQILFSTSGAALSVATLAESDYDAGQSGPTATYTIVTACTGRGGAGCRLFLQYGGNPQGQQLDLQYSVVSIGSGECQGVAANPNAWFPVQPASVVLSTRKNRNCVATFRFRASPVTWTAYRSPGPVGGAYRQQVRFQFTRP